MKRLIIISFLLLLTWIGMASDPVKVFAIDSTIAHLDSLRKQYAINKNYPPDLEHTFLLALTFYPEFSEKQITVKRRNIKTTMQCRPSVGSFFRNKNHRTYNIWVDFEKVKDNGVVFEELPFNAQVGVFGHELGHIVDFESKTNIQNILLGFNYLSPRKKREIEHATDMIAINRGLGYQIDDFATFIFEDSKASESYKSYKKKFYFQPLQIKNILSTIPIYQFKTAVAAD